MSRARPKKGSGSHGGGKPGSPAKAAGKTPAKKPKPNPLSGPPFFMGSPLTSPIEGSIYPGSLVAEGDDPTQSSHRFMGAVMVAMVLITYVVFVPLINTGVVSLGFLVDPQGLDKDVFIEGANTYAIVWGLLASHLALAFMIVAVWAFMRFVHQRRMAWVWSISPGVRWRFFVICLGVSVILIGIVTGYNWFIGPGWGPAPGWGWFVGVVLVTTPFQALAEEVVFRGYLMQVFGSIHRSAWFPIVSTAVVFALFHGVQNPWLFGSRLIFGLVAGVLVWRTGGLEASVAIHVVNNLCVFLLAISTGTLVEIKTTTQVAWTQTVTDLAMFTVCAGVCWFVATRLRVPMVVRKS